MKIGPLQERWLQELEQHPERQEKGTLGRLRKDGTWGYCCLGQALIVINEYEGRKTPTIASEYDNDGNEILHIHDGENNTALLGNSYHKIGLKDDSGSFKTTVEFDGHECGALSSVNDRGMPWPEIAKHIRENPENVFVRSM